MRECGLKSTVILYKNVDTTVTPLAGVWIEMLPLYKLSIIAVVTPLAGVWIEIAAYPDKTDPNDVTPLAGVWIEIFNTIALSICTTSLPLRECGLKYEGFHGPGENGRRSLPLRECGLKWCYISETQPQSVVTPLAGVWIEIVPSMPGNAGRKRHSPCGSVD